MDNDTIDLLHTWVFKAINVSVVEVDNREGKEVISFPT